MIITFLTNPFICFCFGMIFGTVLYYMMVSIYINIKEKERINNRYIYPLEQFMDKYYDTLQFVYRWGDYVYLKYDTTKQEDYLALNIKNKTLTLFKNNEIVFTYSDDKCVKDLHKEYSEEFLNKFHTEIFVDIKKVNNIEMSTNYVKIQYQVYKAMFDINENENGNELLEDLNLNIDNILEKIHISGIESLTISEKEFLKSVS